MSLAVNAPVETERLVKAPLALMPAAVISEEILKDVAIIYVAVTGPINNDPPVIAPVLKVADWIPSDARTLETVTVVAVKASVDRPIVVIGPEELRALVLIPETDSVVAVRDDELTDVLVILTAFTVFAVRPADACRLLIVSELAVKLSVLILEEVIALDNTKLVPVIAEAVINPVDKLFTVIASLKLTLAP